MPSSAVAADVVGALRAAGVQEVDASSRRRAEYASDASLYRVPPLAVAFPRDGDEVAAAVQACAGLEIPITARGSGTSLAGNAVGPGLVLDVGRHLDRVLDLDPAARTARVQPGVILDDLQAHASAHGLRFGPEPSTHSRCTIGGMIGNNACGSRALGFGRTVDHVRDLRLVTGEGRVLGARAAGREDPRIRADLRRLVATYGGAVREELGTFSRQVSGLGLHHLLPEHGEDLPRALVGSEGACGIITEAELELLEVLPERLLVVLGYPDMASAADAVPALLRFAPTAMEGLDARITDAVRRRGGEAALPALPAGGGWLFVELHGTHVPELEALAGQIVRAAGATGSRVVGDPDEMAALWRVREDGSGLVAHSGDRLFFAGWEDAAVPPSELGPYLRAFEELLTDHGLHGVPYGHFGDGCVHVRIDFPFDRPDGQRTYREFLLDAARLVVRFGGSMSGEHGDGRARSELLPLMYSERMLAAFAGFKRIFDPDGMLNPGVIIDPAPTTDGLRPVPAAQPDEGLGFAYPADAGSFGREVHRCTGIARCRVPEPGADAVMCPSFAATRDERDSTRGRARVLQEMLTGDLIEGGWRAPEVHEALDLCLACKGCLSDCPTGVDMATYKAEMLHQSYRRRLRPPSHYSLGWLPVWAKAASLAPGLVNRIGASPTLARPLKRLAGIDERRELPHFAPRTLRNWFARNRRGSAADGRPSVMLWADTFTDRFSPEVGVAAVRVLEDAGYHVRMSPAGTCCALTWISTGQLSTARRRLRRTVRSLRAAADGAPIVGIEPSCTAVLRRDATELLPGDEAASTLSTSVRTLGEVLAARRPDWSPPRLDGRQVVAQPHCHQSAVMGWAADRAVLSATGADVQAVGGCCGLAGNFGVERGHYDVSVAVAETQLLPALDAHPDDADVLADGFSCRTQLVDLRGRRAKHLAQLLAEGLARVPADQDGGDPAGASGAAGVPR